MAMTAREVIKTLTSVPPQATSFLSSTISDHLPPGTKVLSFSPHGTAFWSKTFVIKTLQATGDPKSFFLKVTHTDIGRDNFMGEFESTKAIQSVLPNCVPNPIAWGTYAEDQNVHFLLMEFVDMKPEPLGIEQFTRMLTDLHTKGVSPNGNYGFHVPTFQGALKQPNTWTASWETFFTKMYERAFDWEQSVRGEDEEMQVLCRGMIENVIPRLLRPLETGGNEITPRLLHGDIWYGNSAMNAVTGTPLMFDASSFYGHNEFDLAPWNLPRDAKYRTYIQEYQQLLGTSKPEVDFEDRLILYRVRFELIVSSAFLHSWANREGVVADMRYLVGKYPQGYEGPFDRKTEGG